MPGSTPSWANTPRSVVSCTWRSGRTSSTVRWADAHRRRGVEVVAGRVRRRAFGSHEGEGSLPPPCRPPTRSASSAIPCSSSAPRRSPTSTARSSGSSTTWCRRCTTPPGSAWPRRRSACSSGSSSTTCRTATAPTPSSTRSIAETDGEWLYEEGCLSVPGLSWDIVRPEAGAPHRPRPRRQRGRHRGRRAAARCFLHELDHLDGVLLLERLDTDTRKQALRTIRNLMLDGGLARGPARSLQSRTGRPVVARLGSPPCGSSFLGTAGRIGGRRRLRAPSSTARASSVALVRLCRA